MFWGSDYIKSFIILVLCRSVWHGGNLVTFVKGNTAPFEKMLQWWQAVGNTASDLTGLKYEPLNPGQLRYCSTNWPVLMRLNLAASEIAVSTKTCIWYKYCNKFEISLQIKLSYKRLFEEHTQTLGKSCYCIFFHPKHLLLPDNCGLLINLPGQHNGLKNQSMLHNLGN